jgi:hypothetical protein
MPVSILEPAGADGWQRATEPPKEALRRARRYGEDAGQAAGSVASVAKSMTKVMRARRTGMTAVATRVARHTAVGLASQGRAPAAPAVAGARSS